MLSAVGAPPTRETEPKWSVPAIVDARADPPVVLADSATIADHLEKTRPEPSIYPHGREAQLGWAAAIEENVIKRVAFMILPETPKILPEGDVGYFIETRKRFFGTCVLEGVGVIWLRERTYS